MGQLSIEEEALLDLFDATLSLSRAQALMKKIEFALPGLGAARTEGEFEEHCRWLWENTGLLPAPLHAALRAGLERKERWSVWWVPFEEQEMAREAWAEWWTAHSKDDPRLWFALHAGMSGVPDKKKLIEFLGTDAIFGAGKLDRIRSLILLLVDPAPATLPRVRGATNNTRKAFIRYVEQHMPD